MDCLHTVSASLTDAALVPCSARNRHNSFGWIARVMMSIALLALASCATGRYSGIKDNKYAVLYVDAAKKSRTHTDRVQIFYDRNGDLYPPFESSLSEVEMRGGKAKGTLDLAELFKRTPCAAKELSYELKIDAEGTDAWERIQRQLVDLYQKRLEMMLRAEGKQRTLVVLVHGFNNHYNGADCDYKQARQKLQSLRPKDNFVFLEVFWNGFDKKGGIGIWAAAQHNSTWSGLAFRRLLSALPDDIPVRVITHSRGARFISSALWNVNQTIPWTYKWGAFTWAEYRRYRDRQAQWPTPSATDFRVLMLAPAVSVDTLMDYNQRSNGTTRIVDNSPYVQLMIAQNPKDTALSKKGYAKLTGSLAGSTNLGYDIWLTRKVIAENSYLANSEIEQKDFSGDSNMIEDKGKDLEYHGFKCYLQRTKFPEAVAWLFD